MKTNWVTYVSKLPLSSVWRGSFGERFAGVVMGLIHDVMDQGFTDAAESPYLHLPGATPDDALPFIGSETNINTYAVEPLASFRNRLTSPWSLWRFAGDESVIVSQFAAAGYPGAQVQFDPARTGPRGEAAPYWSQFWIYFPYSSGHPVIGGSPAYGSFTWGDGTLWGLAMPFAFRQLINGIARKWKPGHWLCRGFIFQLADLSTVEAAYGL